MTRKPRAEQMRRMEGMPYRSVSAELLEVEVAMRRETASGIPDVDSVARYAVECGGKRIRPAIFLISAKLCGAKTEGFLDLAAAIELLHTASLLHDDIVDEAKVRRGNSSINGKWGNGMSVLVGDLLWQRALSLLVKGPLAKMISDVTAAVGKMVNGELVELMHLRDTAMTEGAYMDMIRAKTAELFALAARAGATVACAPQGICEALERYGLDVGMAFQLADDVMDYSSDVSVTGKDSGHDIKMGRITYPFIRALAGSSGGERELLLCAAKGTTLSRGGFSELLEIIDRRGGISAAREAARIFSARAKRHLETFEPSAELSDLIAIADYASARAM